MRVSLKSPFLFSLTLHKLRMITIHEAGLNAWFILNFLSLWYQLHGWVIPDPAGMKNHKPLERYSKPIERGGLSIVNLEFQKLGFSQVDRGVR